MITLIFYFQGQLIFQSASIGKISVAKALLHPEWRVAIDKELKGLSDLKSYVLVDRPRDVKVISSHLILDEKPDGTKKARLVARGDEQVYGESYTATWAPTISAKSLRFLCSIAAKHDIKIRVSDANQAFLNAPLKERIFIRPPPHLETKGKVWLMKKALYGLKQAGREWYHERFTVYKYTNTIGSFFPNFFAFLATDETMIRLS